MAMWEIEKARDVKLEGEVTTEATLAKIGEARDVTGKGNSTGAPPAPAVESKRLLDKCLSFLREYMLRVAIGLTLAVIALIFGLNQ